VLRRYLGQSFWQVDLLQLQAEVMRLEWVRRSEVSRHWPGILRVRLTFQTPVARWNDQGLINDAGQVYYPLKITPYLNLVQLRGRDHQAEEVLKHLVQFQQQLDRLALKIQSLHLKDSGIWEVDLVNGQRLVIDREQALSRLERFVQAYPKVKKSYLDLAQGFDLRYSNGFILKKKKSLVSAVSEEKEQTEGQR